MSKNKLIEKAIVESQLSIASNFKLEYTLDDLYKEFGNRKHNAVRLKRTLERRGIKTLPAFIGLPLGELLDFEKMGYDTLRRIKKTLDKMGSSNHIW